MSAVNADADFRKLSERAGRYLTFGLGNESYGISVFAVREIIRTIDITSVPGMPGYVKGVINLRGKVIPVIDLRLRFGMPGGESTGRTCTIVVQVAQPGGVQTRLGLIVDAVDEVAQVTAESMEPPPDFGGNPNTDYIIAMAQVKGSIKTLLDIDKIMAGDAGQKIEVAT